MDETQATLTDWQHEADLKHRIAMRLREKIHALDRDVALFVTENIQLRAQIDRYRQQNIQLREACEAAYPLLAESMEPSGPDDAPHPDVARAYRLLYDICGDGGV